MLRPRLAGAMVAALVWMLALAAGPGCGTTRTIAPDDSQRPRLAIAVDDVPAAVRYYRDVFGGEPTRGEHSSSAQSLDFANMTLVVTPSRPGSLRSPTELAGTSIGLLLFTEDAAGVLARARAAGARVRMELAHAWWGDRYAQVIDPFGHRWGIAERLEDVPPPVQQKRHERVRRGEDWRTLAAPRAKSPIPDGYAVITPVLVVEDADRAAATYARVLGARELFRIHAPGGAIHIEMIIDGMLVMIDRESPGLYPRPPAALGGTSGAVLLRQRSYDRDPSGHRWRLESL